MPNSNSPNDKLILPHGGYRKLLSFQVAQLVYDLTVRFCDRYVDKRSRTVDQMVQSARSGVQNIAEGSQASGTSKKTELRLTNVARASLEELKLDYEDFLRHNSLPQWDPNDPRRKDLIASRPRSLEELSAWAQSLHSQGKGSFPEIAANAALTLITVACSLLGRQIAALEKQFIEQGGFTERLYRVRSVAREKQQKPNR